MEDDKATQIHHYNPPLTIDEDIESSTYAELTDNFYASLQSQILPSIYKHLIIFERAGKDTRIARLHDISLCSFTCSALKSYVRGNEIDQVEPMLPKKSNCSRAHPETYRHYLNCS